MGERAEMLNIVLMGGGFRKTGWRPIESLLRGMGYETEIVTDHHNYRGNSRIGILLNYERILPEDVLNMPELGFVLFHSSDLPKGRGWAPIYNTMVQNQSLTVTAIQAVAEVDAGPIYAKGVYHLRGTEMEQEVRAIDDEITERILRHTLPLLLTGRYRGVPQDHSRATWQPRRRPSDSRLDVGRTLDQLFDQLRAFPESAPGYFDRNGRRYVLKLTPQHALKPVFDEARFSLKCFLHSIEESESIG